ncbi:ABC transporter substrate-binding protein [Microaerobacter geothermalis]|uniref:ABC transporter substrate-binding protein n=1 Tax=Microaerobacter geothermalis TaxID=674972 RepID=UPI001F366C9A|nr:ABC transporter substrate-binding protein [Microaerobacter geothermalis]MCF6093547.1 ABC transporter substrate-binding protein [Microaerobacter geothermalis]
MRRVLAGIFVLFAVILVIVGCGKTETTVEKSGDNLSQKQQENKVFSIGISQIVEHPALDSIRQGIIDGLANKGYEEGKNVSIDYQNAQGSRDTATTISQKFVSDGKDIIIAIATPTAQAAAQSTKDIPVVFASVTDPIAAGLVDDLQNPKYNVTGTSDQNPIDKQIELIKEFMPNVKNIGVLYNSGEVNSEVQVKMAKKAGETLGINVIEKGVTQSNEVQQGAASLIGKVDAYFIPVDNMVVSSFESVLKVAEEANIPVFASDTDTVKRGAVATYGIDYYKIGYQTGEMAARVLDGTDPKDIPVEVTKDVDLVINETSLNKFKISISDETKNRAVEIFK